MWALPLTLRGLERGRPGAGWDWGEGGRRDPLLGMKAGDIAAHLVQLCVVVGLSVIHGHLHSLHTAKPMNIITLCNFCGR